MENYLVSVIGELRQIQSQEECLRKAYDVVTARYRGGRLETCTKIWKLYPSREEMLWPRTGFMHCTNQNRLLRFLLIESGKFTKADCRVTWTALFCFSPHQYLRVRIDEDWIDVDPWAATFGVPFGDHAQGWFWRPRALR